MPFTIKPELAQELFPIAHAALEEAAFDPTSALAQGALEQARQKIRDAVAKARREDVLARVGELRQDLVLLPDDELLTLLELVLAPRSYSVLAALVARLRSLMAPPQVIQIPEQPEVEPLPAGEPALTSKSQRSSWFDAGPPVGRGNRTKPKSKKRKARR